MSVSAPQKAQLASHGVSEEHFARLSVLDAKHALDWTALTAFVTKYAPLVAGGAPAVIADFLAIFAAP